MTAPLPQTQSTAEQPAVSISHFINNRFVPSQSGETFENLNPATNRVLAHVALGGEAEINQAVSAAKRAFDDGPWPRMTLEARCKILHRIGDLILDNCDRLAVAESMDTGKPVFESQNGDIPRAAQNFHFFAQYAPAQNDACYSPSPNEHHITQREPLGVVGLITPWNLPLYLASWKIAPCLAMGNTIVLKPAELTPYTAHLLCELVEEAGLPEGVLNVVHGFGPNSAGEALTRHPDVRAISFTGETVTGKAIMAAAAPTLKRVSFELGGKGATILFDDADLDEALPTAINAAFRNQGEICLAGSRLYVQASILDQVLPRLIDYVNQIRVGDPLDPATRMGALISREHLEKVMEYIEIARQEGQILTGGGRISGLEGNFLEPTLVTGLSNDSRVCAEEIFGPVLPVIPFEDEAQVIAMTNSTPYGLSSSLWSRDINRCHRVAQQLKMGMVWVNCWFARDLRTPFGGQKSSGIGREGGQYSLSFFSESKTISTRYKP